MNVIKSLVYSFFEFMGMLLLWPVIRREWHVGRFSTIIERSVEYPYAMNQAAISNARRILDVGCGRSAWPAILTDCGYKVTAVDKIHGYWDKWFINRHHLVITGDVTRGLNMDGEFDMVTCISVMEHIEDHQSAFANMMKMLRPGGILTITFPYNEDVFVENVYQHPDSGYGVDFGFICRVYSRAEIAAWMECCPAELIDQKFFRVFTGKFWSMGERILPVEPSSVDEPHHLLCATFRRPC